MSASELKELYIDPRTDFGFKFLFGTPMNKDLLIGFLNALFHGTHTITDLTYLNGEQLGIHKEDRRAIFDVYCEAENGEKFIVEMQNVFQQFFKDRSVYYSTFPIREQAQRGEWDYRLEAVYTVGILNFVFDEDKNSKDYYHHEVKLMDVNTKKVFYDKLTFIYLELPKFTKTEHELETLFEKWVFVLKNLSRLLERPAALQERVFNRLFEAASIARFTPKQLREYEDSVKAYRDIVNAVNTARIEGREEGWEKGREDGLEEGIAKGERKKQIEIARQMRTDGIPVDTILKYTGLSEQDINEL
ncbi:Rpn family recombination-promoting nuclease/putative transposase [uncultured Bacteroides sp.]|uniref:Rpn family recombination-promoting nuclease/putative transposase n=1 Tax=uncultured Bacteroides sp. TaxID=162156 RepID=UPI0025D4324D|nr:Rpn family recombination-promoting nuclease/putative transposase [uncultured Bacteroides sp.]